jgi:hypothetical protein
MKSIFAAFFLFVVGLSALCVLTGCDGPVSPKVMVTVTVPLDPGELMGP